MSGSASSRNTRRAVFRVVGDENTASTRYRVLAHFNALQAAGFETELQTQWRAPGRMLQRPLRFAELMVDSWRSPRAELVMIHRRTYPPLFARRFRNFEIPVVFDLDDAIYLPPPSAPQDLRTVARYRRNFLATVTEADVVICGNGEVARQVPHERVEILPTPVDCRRFSPERIDPATEPVVGWVGHSDNLPFLESLAEPLRELARRRPDFRLVVVADREPRIEGVPIEFRRWTLEAEVSCFSDIAVGLMPLQDTPWTRAKCSFKLLQYMALGIAAVAAPVGMNREVVDDGRNAILATETNEWLRSIDRLLDDHELRRELAIAGRRTVETRYSLEVMTPRLVDLLSAQIARGRRDLRDRMNVGPG